MTTNVQPLPLALLASVLVIVSIPHGVIAPVHGAPWIKEAFEKK